MSGLLVSDDDWFDANPRRAFRIRRALANEDGIAEATTDRHIIVRKLAKVAYQKCFVLASEGVSNWDEIPELEPFCKVLYAIARAEAPMPINKIKAAVHGLQNGIDFVVVGP